MAEKVLDVAMESTSQEIKGMLSSAVLRPSDTVGVYLVSGQVSVKGESLTAVSDEYMVNNCIGKVKCTCSAKSSSAGSSAYVDLYVNGLRQKSLNFSANSYATSTFDLSVNHGDILVVKLYGGSSTITAYCNLFALSFDAIECPEGYGIIKT